MDRRPIAVIIGDIHFTLSTLELATASTKLAIAKAKELGVPVVLNGDTLDSKAIIRAEVANRLISILKDELPGSVIVNTGNHDLCNEKGEESALNFLEPYARVVRQPVWIGSIGAYVIPYQADPKAFEGILAECVEGSILIVHQGVEGANLGHYVQDKSAPKSSIFDGFIVIGSHYHAHQTIKCGKTGTFTYVGSPYTTSFGEANDPPKGFLVLYSDGSFERVLTNLRNHVICNWTTNELKALKYAEGPKEGDLIWLKVTGPRSELDKLNKQELGTKLFGHSNFKLDKIYTEEERAKPPVKLQTDYEAMDSIIDQTTEGPEQKSYLKILYKELME